MREEHKLNKAIQQNGVDTQSDILDELKRRYPQYAEQPEDKQVPVRRRRFAFISAVAAVAVCVAIVVPCAVLLPNRNTDSGNGGKENIRYCKQGEYDENVAQYTIREYREDNNRNFLYFDWYETGEDIYTVCYISNVDDEVLCLEEQAYLSDKDEFVQLSITKSNVYLSKFDTSFQRCQWIKSVDNHEVKWAISLTNALCIFEDNGYRYFILIDQEQDENKLFELVAELLETK